jgi:hypothetical protein
MGLGTMSRARLHALTHEQVLGIIRRAAPSAPPPAPPVGCTCHRCVVNALARLHAEFEAGVHADPAGALADVMHKHFSRKTLARAASGALPCREARQS